MAHSYAAIWMHVVFATQDRHPWLTRDLRARLLPYLNAVMRRTGAIARALDGVEDRLHALVLLKPEVSVAELMRVAKANSSKWIHDEFPKLAPFAWQEGYSAFSVSMSQCERVERYILGQEQHHRQQTFQDELREFLVRHGVEVDPRRFPS